MTSWAELNEHQRQRLLHGACHAIIQQALDNGELPVVDYSEYLPVGFGHESPEEEMEFNSTLQAMIEATIQSDLFEKAAQNDV